jgi:hypothetical protein
MNVPLDGVQGGLSIEIQDALSGIHAKVDRLRPQGRKKTKAEDQEEQPYHRHFQSINYNTHCCQIQLLMALLIKTSFIIEMFHPADSGLINAT